MSSMTFTGQFKEALKTACAAIRKGEAGADFKPVGSILINSGFILNVEIKTNDRWSMYTARITTRGMINNAGPLVDLESREIESDSIADILEMLKNCAAVESFDAVHAAYLEKDRHASADKVAREFIEDVKPAKYWRMTTTDRDGEKMFLTADGLWSYYRDNAELFDHMPESSDPNSFYGTPIRYEVAQVNSIAIGDANHARVKVVTVAGMILIAPYFAIKTHDDGCMFSERWLMRHNLIENREFCTYIKPDSIKSVEFIK